MKILAIGTVSLVMCMWSIVDLLQFVASGQSVAPPLISFLLAVAMFFCFTVSLIAFYYYRTAVAEMKNRGKT